MKITITIRYENDVLSEESQIEFDAKNDNGLPVDHNEIVSILEEVKFLVLLEKYGLVDADETESDNGDNE